MSIRVLHIVSYMGRGGLETMIMNYYRHIDRTKVQFDFLVHRDFTADYDNEILALGGNIYHVPMLNPFSPSYFKALDSFFSEHHYDIVHSHLDCMSAYPLKIAEKHGVKTRIAHSHNSGQEHNLKYLVKEYAKRQIPRYATDLLACSKAAGKWMFPGHEFQVLKNAIDAGQFIFNPKKANILPLGILNEISLNINLFLYSFFTFFNSIIGYNNPTLIKHILFINFL